MLQVSIVLIYLLYLTKDVVKKKEDHHGEAIRRVQRHGYFKYSRPPRQPLRNGLAEDSYEGFYLIT
jgi:hypothetical protein